MELSIAEGSEYNYEESKAIYKNINLIVFDCPRENILATFNKLSDAVRFFNKLVRIFIPKCIKYMVFSKQSFNEMNIEDDVVEIYYEVIISMFEYDSNNNIVY